MNEEYSVKIEKMLSNGAGLARINGMSVFINDAAPDDTVKIKITKRNKSYFEGAVLEIEKPSEYRIKPLCALSKVCGSCDWQHIAYDEQLRQKKQIIEETLKKIAGIDINSAPVIPSPKIEQYRCKVQLPYAQTKVSKRLLSGYYKKKTHELVNIKYCPMQPEIINEINEFIKENAAGVSGYDEKTGKGLLRHIIYRISSDLKQILIIFVINSDVIDKSLKNLSKMLIEKYPQITGISANFNTKKTNVITGDKTRTISGNDYYIETLNGFKYKVSSSSFFQVNPYCAEYLFSRVKELIVQRVQKPSILDAYAGVSSFGVQLSSIAEKITCIEEIKSASRDAEENLKLNNISNITVINGDAALEFEKLCRAAVKFDVSIIDPPRSGCAAGALEYLSKLTSKYIIYVSCNPSSAARDIKILKEKGFELEYVQGIDMFPNTCSTEMISVLKLNLAG